MGEQIMPLVKRRDVPLSKEALESLFQSAADGLLVIDGERTIVAVNPALERMTGWKREEIVGKKDCLSLFRCREDGGTSMCDHPERCPGLSALKFFTQTPSKEFSITTKEGKALVVNASYAPVFTHSWEPSCAVAIFRDVSEQKRLQGVLQRQAVTDGLTGLYNYRYFYDHLSEEIKRAKRYSHPLSLILVDVDSLKDFNDRYGHLEGDSLLVQAGKVLKASLRETDVLARYGGDEFVILLPNTDKKQAFTAAEKLRRRMEGHLFRSRREKHYFTRPNGRHVYHATVSVGVASFPEDARGTKGLVRTVDEALYGAKSRGKNRAVVARTFPQGGERK